MRSIIAAFVLFLSSGVNGQVPHTFQNGQAADADKVNENFEYVLENASGGCSATQQDSSVLITCADGTSGVIAGAGTVVLVPEGVVGDTPNVDISVGEIAVVDGNDVVLGVLANVGSSQYETWISWSAEGGVTSGRSTANISNEGGLVTVKPITNRSFFYTSSDCSGQPFTNSVGRKYLLYSADDESYYVFEGTSLGTLLAHSHKQLADGPDASSDGDCVIAEEILNYFYLPITYTFPEELINAAYPVRLKQF